MLCVAFSFKKLAKYISFLIQPLQNWHCFQVISSARWLHLCLEECETSESNHCVCWHTKQGSINRKTAPWHRQRWGKKGEWWTIKGKRGKKRVSYDSFTHTLHNQDPLGMTTRHLRHTLWLHILHWLEKKVSRLRGSRHLPQTCWLYLPLPRLAPFLFTSSKSDFSFLWQKHDMFSIREAETHSTSHLFKSR